jgi:hypothetical protein
MPQDLNHSQVVKQRLRTVLLCAQHDYGMERVACAIMPNDILDNYSAVSISIVPYPGFGIEDIRTKTQVHGRRKSSRPTTRSIDIVDQTQDIPDSRRQCDTD